MLRGPLRAALTSSFFGKTHSLAAQMHSEVPLRCSSLDELRNGESGT